MFKNHHILDIFDYICTQNVQCQVRMLTCGVSCKVAGYEWVDAEKPMVGMTNFKGGYITK